MIKIILPFAKTNRRNSILILLLLFGLTGLRAQTQIYFQDFNTGAASEWSLNTAGGTLGGYTGLDENYWLIGNAYAGNILANATPDEPAGITGYPESYYMHVTNGSNNGFATDYNANFLAPTTGLQITAMNTGIVTTGYTGVTLSFWYLCNGNATKYYGILYYSINNGTTWVQEGGTTTYSLISSWTQATITDPAWNNVASLEFAFVWDQKGGNAGNDPPWAIDDIKLVGTSSTGSCPLVINSQTSTNPTCNGSNNGTITITASGGSTINYTINNGTAITNTTGIFTGLAPGTYTVSVSDTCTTTGTNIVITNPAAVPAPTASNTGPYCVGGTLTLNATTVSGATYAWTGPNSFSTQSATKSNIALTDSGIYTVVATVGGCNSAPATTRVIINAAPAAPTATNTGPICAGGTLQLNATTIANATYSWTGPASFSTQNPSIANATVADSGTYTVVATVGGCSSAPATTTADVKAAPAAPIAGNTGPACAGANVQLTASTIANATYTWTGPNNFAVQNPTINSASGADSGTYTVVATVNGCNSPGASTTLVIISALAAPTVSNNGPLCVGGTLQLTANSVNGATYSWTGPNNFNTHNPSISNVTLSDSGTYTVIASVSGCSSPAATTKVVIYPLPPAPTPGSNSPVCVGDTLNLTASTVSGATYAWSGPNNFNQQNPSITNVSSSDSGTYTVIVTVGLCSSLPVTVTAVVKPAPAAPTASNTGPACIGGTIQLNATTVSGASYTWTGPNNFIVQNPSISNATLADAGTYTVFATVGTCNSLPATTTVVVNGPPTAPTITSADSVVCSNDTATICVQGTYAGYIWSNGDTTACFSTTSVGGYTLTVTDANGCTAQSSNTINITNYSPSPVTLNVTGDTLSSTGAFGYQWYLNGQAIAGDTTGTIVATQSGNYSVQITNSHGCYSSSTETYVNISGIGNVIAGNGIKVYPNPLQDGNWQVDIGENLTGSTCEIFDANGRLVYKGVLSSVHSEISLNAAAGIYMMQIRTEQSSYNVKLVKLY